MCRSCPLSSLHHGSGFFDSAQDPRLRAAATEVLVQRPRDLSTGWRWIAIEQCLRAHDDAGETVAALPRLLIEERLLQRMRRRRRAQPFDRHYTPAGCGANLA